MACCSTGLASGVTESSSSGTDGDGVGLASSGTAVVVVVAVFSCGDCTGLWEGLGVLGAGLDVSGAGLGDFTPGLGVLGEGLGVSLVGFGVFGAGLGVFAAGLGYLCKGLRLVGGEASSCSLVGLLGSLFTRKGITVAAMRPLDEVTGQPEVEMGKVKPVMVFERPRGRAVKEAGITVGQGIKEAPGINVGLGSKLVPGMIVGAGIMLEPCMMVGLDIMVGLGMMGGPGCRSEAPGNATMDVGIKGNMEAEVMALWRWWCGK